MYFNKTLSLLVAYLAYIITCNANFEKETFVAALKENKRQDMMILLAEEYNSEDPLYRVTINENCVSSATWLFHAFAQHNKSNQYKILKELIPLLSYSTILRCTLQSDEIGNTPLHYAVIHDNFFIVELLFTHIPQEYHCRYAYERNADGKTVFDYMSEDKSPRLKTWAHNFQRSGNSPIEYVHPSESTPEEDSNASFTAPPLVADDSPLCFDPNVIPPFLAKRRASQGK